MNARRDAGTWNFWADVVRNLFGFFRVVRDEFRTRRNDDDTRGSTHAHRDDARRGDGRALPRAEAHPRVEHGVADSQLVSSRSNVHTELRDRKSVV